MAKISEHTRHQLLKELIASAVEELDDFVDGEGVTVAISPTLDEVYATTHPWWDDEVLSEKISEGWSLESADTAEELIRRADFYFDLR